eukprot:CAMPEP_0179413130 /NCGR_PEP_ID=MMETSP0799-20121207/4910_1 /TAXON_ID=46947 /ORGANISM="Geminigera cryophila, Strain CCMP2564" /LENGTH=343 /DNA_ID=CAMNT_0021185533 /DNA_START=195 /DNA_END=1222 /DNA_ORIENTATION=-
MSAEDAGPPPTAGDDDWRAFRALLVSREKTSSAPPGVPVVGSAAADYSAPEPGCLLLASPAKFKGRQSYFSRAVVLLVEHDDMVGSVALLLNRRTPFTVGDVAPSLAMFSQCPVHIGGPVGDSLYFTHRLPEVHGSTQLMNGVYFGGDLAHAAFLIRKHGITREGMAQYIESFTFFYKYCSWGPGQLARELGNTTIGALLEAPSPVWFPAATSAFYVTTKPRARRAKSLRTHTSNSLWNTVMCSLGDSFGVSLAPHQQLQDDTTDDQHDMRDIINRETLDPSSDYHTWKGILAPSFSSLAPTQRSRVLEMACLHIADIEAEADHLQHVLCVQERGGERGGEAG